MINGEESEKNMAKGVNRASRENRKLLHHHTCLPSVLPLCGRDNHQGKFDRIQNQKGEK